MMRETEDLRQSPMDLDASAVRRRCPCCAVRLNPFNPASLRAGIEWIRIERVRLQTQIPPRNMINRGPTRRRFRSTERGRQSAVLASATGTYR
jgi:hypothetical protein